MNTAKSLLTAALLGASAAALPVATTLANAADSTPSTVFVPAQAADQYLAKDHLIGAKVKGKNGKIIADIEDLIINASNQVVGVVIGTGGFFGISEKRIGVDLNSLSFGEENGKVTVTLPDIAEEDLKTAPEYARAQPPKSLFERAKEKVQELSDKTTATTKDAIEKAKPMLEDATKTTQEAYEKTKEAVSPALEKAGEAISGAVESAKETVAPTPEATPEGAAPDAAAPSNQ